MRGIPDSQLPVAEWHSVGRPDTRGDRELAIDDWPVRAW